MLSGRLSTCSGTSVCRLATSSLAPSVTQQFSTQSSLVKPNKTRMSYEKSHVQNATASPSTTPSSQPSSSSTSATSSTPSSSTPTPTPTLTPTPTTAPATASTASSSQPTDSTDTTDFYKPETSTTYNRLTRAFVNPFPDYSHPSLLKTLKWQLGLTPHVDELREKDSGIREQYDKPITYDDVFPPGYLKHAHEIGQSEAPSSASPLLSAATTSKFTPTVEEMSRFMHFSWPQYETLHKVTEKFPCGTAPKELNSVTWLGHASALVQIQGVNILIDPIFSERCSPSQLFGPKRLLPAPLQTIDDLPFIDIIVISHNHYDHLDHDTCMQLVRKTRRDTERYGFERKWNEDEQFRQSVGLGRPFKRSSFPLHMHNRQTKWYVPVGLKSWLRSRCGLHAREMEDLHWWEQIDHPLPNMKYNQAVLDHHEKVNDFKAQMRVSTSFFQRMEPPAFQPPAEEETPDAPTVSITLTPAQHWSRRSVFDTNLSLWGGFVIQVNDQKVFYSGDTGYCSAFKEIGQVLGPMDLSLLPIGAYSPRWFMRSMHVDPFEAVKMHKDVQSKLSVPVHWGTFRLSEEPVMEPIYKLKKACQALDVPPNEFKQFRMGETVYFNANEQTNIVALIGDKRLHGQADNEASTSSTTTKE